jgi:hypothetical protein
MKQKPLHNFEIEGIDNTFNNFLGKGKDKANKTYKELSEFTTTQKNDFTTLYDKYVLSIEALILIYENKKTTSYNILEKFLFTMYPEVV